MNKKKGRFFLSDPRNVDYDYLKAVAQEYKCRKISFAAHFDKFMFGRRGIKRPKDEESLNPFRQEFCAKFERLKQGGHVDRFFLAHNMTITPGNVEEVLLAGKMCVSC